MSDNKENKERIKWLDVYIALKKKVIERIIDNIKEIEGDVITPNAYKNGSIMLDVVDDFSGETHREVIEGFTTEGVKVENTEDENEVIYDYDDISLNQLVCFLDSIEEINKKYVDLRELHIYSDGKVFYNI